MSQLRYFKLADALLRNRTCLSSSIFRGNERFYSSAAENTTKEVATQTTSKESMANAQVEFDSLKHHRVNKLDRLALVWGGKYKSSAEVPNFVSQDSMERARNKARIKINLMMAAATVFGCMLMIMSGKKAQSRGESVAKSNEDWHKKIKEEANAAASSASVGGK